MEPSSPACSNDICGPSGSRLRYRVARREEGCEGGRYLSGWASTIGLLLRAGLGCAVVKVRVRRWMRRSRR